MSLPIANTPVYKLTIPSLSKSVMFRPFLVKEEKALLIAQQSEDSDTMIETLKNVITACIKDKVKVDELALFDIEYIFTQLRAKSVGENVDLILKCDTCTDEKASVMYTIDLTKVKVDIPKEHNKTIPLFDDVGVVMKYPSLDILSKMEKLETTDIDTVFDIVCSCVDAVYNSQEMFYAKDQKPDEVREFVNNLTQEQFVKIQQFFDTMPKLEERVKYTCPVCSKNHEKYIRGLDSFF
jgi:hypothetical protein